MIKLKPHQLYPVTFIKNNFGLILYHSTGSGKTITALSGMYQFNKDIIIIGPKSSKKIFLDEIKNLNYDSSKFSIYTYKKIKNMMYDNIDIFKDKCVIVDEAHHLRSPTNDNIFLTSILTNCFRIFLLTATPIVNYLNDIAILVNIAKQRDVLPTERELFNFFYFDEDSLEINNEHLLREKLKNCISYYEKENAGDYPKSSIFFNKVVMSKPQLEEYIRYVKKLIYDKENGSTSDILSINFDVLESRKKNAFMNATRQLSNTVDGQINMPKIEAILETIEKNGYPAVVYSNYKKNGIFPVAKMLNNNDITFKVITGTTSLDKINIIVNAYNNGEFDVLLLTSAGSESLDLKNTKQIHIMEPHWNEAKIKQVIGRAIRYRSHSALPKKDRHVKIYKWISVFPKPYENISSDEYLMNISDKKEAIFNTFKKIIIDSSIEKNKKGGYYAKYVKYKKKYLKLKINTIG